MLKIIGIVSTAGKAVGLTGAGLLALTTLAAAVDFEGRTQKSVFVRTNQTPSTINESSVFSALPGGSIGAITVASGDTDLFTLQFSAQLELRNASSVVGGFNRDDVFELQVLAVTDSTGTTFAPSPPTAFASGNTPGAYSMSWAARLPAGTWTLQVMGRVVDQEPAAAVSARLSSWTMIIARYN